MRTQGLGMKKIYNGSWSTLKGGGKLATKVGNGEQMCGMVSGLGSVSGLPLKKGVMIMLSRNFGRRLMMGVFPRVCSVVLWERGGLQFRVLGGDIVFFFG